MRVLGEVAQRAQTDHALTHRGHTPLGAAHATAYVHARDLTATATNCQALWARDGHTPVQRRLRVRKERLSGVAIVPQPCLLCDGPEETPVHVHVGCAHSQLLWPHYRQAVHEAARHLPPGDKALWVASWPSAGATWTEVFCSGLVPEDAEAQLRAMAGTTRREGPPWTISSTTCCGWGTTHGSLATTGWSNSSASPKVRRSGHTGGSLRRRATTLPLPRALTRTS